MSAGRILVVALSPDLRHSLVFALAAEGYVVTSHAAIPATDASRGYDCVVLDHRATRDVPQEMVLAFMRRRPCVLLAGASMPWLADAAARVVPTPVLGGTLSAAVSAVIAARDRPAPVG